MKWAYTACGITWIVTAVAVIAAIRITKSAMPLWALFIPLFINLNTTKICVNCDKSTSIICDACGKSVSENHSAK